MFVILIRSSGTALSVPNAMTSTSAKIVRGCGKVFTHFDALSSFRFKFASETENFQRGAHSEHIMLRVINDKTSRDTEWLVKRADDKESEMRKIRMYFVNLTYPQIVGSPSPRRMPKRSSLISLARPTSLKTSCSTTRSVKKTSDNVSARLWNPWRTDVAGEMWTRQRVPKICPPYHAARSPHAQIPRERARLPFSQFLNPNLKKNFFSLKIHLQGVDAAKKMLADETVPTKERIILQRLLGKLYSYIYTIQERFEDVYGTKSRSEDYLQLTCDSYSEGYRLAKEQ